MIRPCSLALGLVLVGAIYGPPAFAQPSPLAVVPLDKGTELTFHSNGIGSDGGPGGFGPSVRVWNFWTGEPEVTIRDCQLDGDSGPQCWGNTLEIEPLSTGEKPSSAVSAGPVGQAMFLADPNRGVVWRVDPVPSVGAQIEVVASTTLDGASLASPVAVAAAGDQLWFVEGYPPADETPCAECVNSQYPGVHRVEAGLGPVEALGLWGNHQGDLPPASTKALTVWRDEDTEQAELWAVTGSPARVLAWSISDLIYGGSAPDDRFLFNWPVPHGWACDGMVGEIGDPTEIVVLKDHRVILGSQQAIVAYTPTGSVIGEVWNVHAQHEDLQSANGGAPERLMSLITSPQGSGLFGLFATNWSSSMPDNSGPAVLVQWVWNELPTTDDGEVFTVDQDGGQYTRIQEAIEAACSGDQIVIADGEYSESLYITGKQLRISAENPGRVIVDAGGADQPVLQVRQVGEPGVQVDGLILQGGSGAELRVPDGSGGELDITAGGGVLVYEASFSGKRLIIRWNEAQLGAGFAALAHAGVALEASGIYGNMASGEAAGVGVAGMGLFQGANSFFDHITVTRNDRAADEPVSEVTLISTMINVSNSIIDSLGEGPAIATDSISGCVEASNLTPADEWDGLLDNCGAGGNIHKDPRFVDAEAEDPDLHLSGDSPSHGAGIDGVDQGMYGSIFDDWYPQEAPGDDDDDDTTDDDDDTVEDDDDATDDDDSAVDPLELLPSGLRCSDCGSSSVGPSARMGGLALLLMLAPLAAARRRRRSATISALLAATLLLPAAALADGPPIANVTEMDIGEAFFWTEAIEGDGDIGEIVVIGVDATSETSEVQYQRFNAETLVASSELDGVGNGPTSVASAASWGTVRGLVADPQTGHIWRVSTNPYSSVEIPIVFGGSNSSDVGDEPCRPVAVASRAGSDTLNYAFYAGGSLSFESFPWAPYYGVCPESSNDGIYNKGSALSTPQQPVPAGPASGQVPVDPTKGLAFDMLTTEPMLTVVAGRHTDQAGDEGFNRVLRYNITSGETDDWMLNPTLLDENMGWPGIGDVFSVAPLDGDRLAVAGRRGILLFDLTGNLLDGIFVPGTDYLQDETEQVDQVLDITSNEDGTVLYALLAVEADRLLVSWNSNDLTYSGGIILCVDPELGGDCVEGSSPCDVVCPSIAHAALVAPSQSTILLGPGEYNESLYVANKSLTIQAQDPGSVVVRAEAGMPALSVLYTGEPGVIVEGIVLTGGSGYELFGSGMTFGGGVLVVSSSLEMRQSVVIGNEADGGGGIGAVGARAVDLENVGLLRNSAALHGGGIAILGTGLEPSTKVVLRYTTIANNVSAFGHSACIAGADLRAELAILFAEEEGGICTTETNGSTEGSIEYSSLWPDPDWIITSDAGPIDLAELGMLGEGVLNANCNFVNSPDDDYHLLESSPCADTQHPEEIDWDGSGADMGMYGGPRGEWDWREGGGDDDDDTVDDDDTGDDDDDTVDDDDTGDDDDSGGVTPLDELLPAGLRCDSCSLGSTGGGPGALLLLVLLPVLRRRRR